MASTGSLDKHPQGARGKSDRDPTHAKFYGSVEEMPQGGGEGIWRVNGRKILVTGDTRIKEKYGAATVGSYVEVEGNFSGETFTVYKLEVKDGNRHKSRKEHNHIISGKIEAMPQDGYEGRWVVSGYMIEVNSATLIDESTAKASPGGEARIIGFRAKNIVNAFRIKITAMPQ